MTLRLVALALLAALLSLSACGKKGDPIRPGEEPEERESLFD